ncbi:MAG: YbbR-like domain-containing protein, partial [Proteobacteria bacterium]|nr:YbbR-like domain-containing protein [Pseudomonadota bacterium]
MNKSLFKNPVQKLLAFSFALIIWAVAPEIQKDDLTEVQFFVPISYVNLPRDFEITSPPISSISLTVEFSQNEIKNIHPSLFQVALDLEKADAGITSYRITHNNIKSPSAVKILKVSPETIDLTFERTVERELPINPVFVGEPAQGYVLKKVTMIPSVVQVRGPDSIMTKIDQLETKAINIEGMENNIDMLVHVLFPDKIDATPPTPDFYTARIQIGSQPVSIRYLDVPLGLVNQTYVTKINPKVFNVLLRGPRSLLNNFTKEDIQAFINLEKYKPGNYKTSTPTIRLRPEIQIQKIWPPIDIWVLDKK